MDSHCGGCSIGLRGGAFAQFKIRKEALLGLALLYKQHMSSVELPQSTLECIAWIKNKVLHVYYQTALDDR